MRLKYGKFLPSDIVTLNETDEFQSEFRTNHKVVIFDDVAAMSGLREQVDPDPWRKVIDFVNNIRKTALNPNVELKGNVYIEPDLVIITTNRAPYFSLSRWCYCPMAIIRRVSKNIHLLNDRESCTFVELNKEFLRLRGETFDSSPDIRIVNDFSYKECLTKYSKKVCDYPHAYPNDESLKRIKKEEMFKIVANEFMVHLEDQAVFIDRINSNFDKVVERTFFSAVYNDLVKPFLPILPKMEDQILYKMSYWYRLKYFISVKEIVPIAQMSYDDNDIGDVEFKSFDYSESSQIESLNQELEYLNINTPLISIPIELEIRKNEYSSLAPLVLCESWKWCTRAGNEISMPRGLPFKKAVISKVQLFAHWIGDDYLSSYPNALTFFIYLLFDNSFMNMNYIRVEKRHVLCVGTFHGHPFMLGLNATDEDQYLPNVDPMIPFFRITLDGLKVYSNKPIPFILDDFLSNYKEACKHLRYLLVESIPKYDRKIFCQKY
jgi:hypothetical protein